MDTKEKISIAIDVGGSHLSVGIIDHGKERLLENSVQIFDINPHETATQILDKWVEYIQKLIADIPHKQLGVMGIAIPGPFDYKNGVSQIIGLNKYTSLFGINIKQYLSSSLNISSEKIHFINDASAFALGEFMAQESYSKVLGLTLGTGFGSTYIVDGVPQEQMLYSLPFKEGIANDYFSTDWFLKTYFAKTKKDIDGVKALSQMAQSGDNIALKVFEEFGINLGTFLKDHIQRTKTECCIIGGNISLAWDLFYPSLAEQLDTNETAPIQKANLNNQSALTGAFFYAQNEMREITKKRKTSQFLIPENVQASSQGSYDIYPGHKVPAGSISVGYEGLADFITKHKTVVIDGFAGVFWEDYVRNISQRLLESRKKVIWHNVAAAFRKSEDINDIIEPFLGGDDPIFGYRADIQIEDLFDSSLLAEIKPDKEAEIHIIYGPGASLCNWEAPLIYIDLPKNELQFRMRAGAITNLGADKPQDPKAMYKRFYFVDWPLLNEHKRKLSKSIDLLVDDQRPEMPFWTSGNCVRQSLREMSENFFRVRPWFEPGPWGGTWMKEQINQLSQDVPNYAWSFELIVPENGLMLEDQGRMLELSFDFLMFREYKNILGEAAEHFKYDFPIRFDYLDTFDGGNLSVQVHPQQDYFVKEFGETFTQDECYYMLDTKGDSKVYLGFQEDIKPDEFKNELEKSFEQSTEVDIDKYVKTVDSNNHDLFLIPNGTIHGSGKDNLVLEISSTPYIFTFKLYDWLRLDLEGKPRPLNIERGFKNLDFSRKGEVVEREHISKPVVIEKGEDWSLIHLPTHKEHFYDVHRYEFKDSVEVKTEDQCHIMMLVEGTSLILETEQGAQQRFNYAETFVIPAACQSYRLINESNTACKVVKAFVKPEKVKQWKTKK